MSVASVDAQILTRHITSGAKRDSVVAAGTKYLTIGSTPSKVHGMSVTGIKAATGGGTVSAYVIMQVRTDTMPTTATSVWEDYVYPGTTKRDTLFLTDLTTAQGHQWPVPVHFFNGIRAKIVSTGTQKVYYYLSHLRR